MKTERRPDDEGARTRAAILDATEALMREEGYAAVSSRRVAGRAGLKSQLVHYHFGSMDELFLALLRRHTEEYFARQLQALTSRSPLRALWQFSLDAGRPQLVQEFIALANHRKAIRNELARTNEMARQIESAVLTRVLEDAGLARDDYPAAVVSLLIAAASRTLVTETTLGVTGGHPETLAFIERWLNELEAGTRRVPAAVGAAE
jgi:AcrR family transcriptional regulator